jgi:para-aminobenzoate synthetase component 2
MIVLIDNYDSFTYNLFQYLRELRAEVRVFRNDKITASGVAALSPAAIVISPGPGRPRAAGVTRAVIKNLSEHIPILGVCLGHQAIGEVFGAKVVRAQKLMHGKTSQIKHDGKTIFHKLPSPLTVMRYHSLTLAEQTIPRELRVTARSLDDGEVMAIRHQSRPLEGVQFHPESVMTQSGKKLLANFLAKYLRGKR